MIEGLSDLFEYHRRTQSVIERLKADLAYHQAARAELAEELSDLSEAYSAETDTAESYHAGRVEALNDAINLLLGQEVKLYSETEATTA